MDGKFKLHDLINAARVIQAADVKANIGALLKTVSGEHINDTDVLFLLVDCLTKPGVEAQFERFACELFELEPETYRQLDLLELMDAFKDFASGERWKDFFGRAQGFARKMSST